MNALEMKQWFIDSIQPVYDTREARNIFKIVHEDIFDGKQIFSDTDKNAAATISDRLNNHEPIQYILGAADFFGLKIKVTESVLIPRPETEELVNEVIKTIKTLKNVIEPIHIIDICTGSGCIAIVLKKYIPDATVTAIDISPTALKVAKENAVLNETEIDFVHNDFLNDTSWNKFGKFHCIVSNPPYISAKEFDALDKKVKYFEPHIALRAFDEDPLIFYRKLAAFGKLHLEKNGFIFCEMNASLSKEIKTIFETAGYDCTIVPDINRKERMLRANQNFR